ncbi:MAG: HipA family kinase, partial [Rhodanobacteraceae bacterium]
DEGMYVLKFRGAGQGTRALIAELIAGEMARALGLNVPEIVLVNLDPELARTEPDPEIQHLIRASAGVNLALDYLPGSVTFDAIAETPAGELASAIVWFDAFVSNVDRTPRNTNLLMWHRRLWLIDHGAALYFHHGGDDWIARSADPFARIADHVLLPFADALASVDPGLTQRLESNVIDTIVQQVPDNWFGDGSGNDAVNANRLRSAYADYLNSRLQAPHAFLEEAIRARSSLL